MSTKRDRLSVNILVDREVKIAMKVQSLKTDIPTPVIWEEAAIQWLKTKGINIILPAEETEKEPKTERLTA